MTRVFVTLGVLLIWALLTALAAWFTPPRLHLDRVDLAVDTHWKLAVPPNPILLDKGAKTPLVTTTIPTTTTATMAPRRVTRPRPPPAPRVPSTAGVEQWRAMVAAYGDWDTNLMLRIMGCESGGRANAYNRSSATGLFQILGGPFDPAANIALAHSMWLTRGTQPWYPSRSCWG